MCCCWVFFKLSEVIAWNGCGTCPGHGLGEVTALPLAVSHRWKRLIRRGGKGGLIVERRTRLCSRHFDAHAVGEGDPKYFAWNNWGNPITTSSADPGHCLCFVSSRKRMFLFVLLLHHRHRPTRLFLESVQR